MAGLILIALLAHLMVIVESFSNRWFFSIAPTEWTPKHFSELFHRGLTGSSIRNSLFYSSLSALLDLGLGVVIAWLLTRPRIPFPCLLVAPALLPLALPGIVLALVYLAGSDFHTSLPNPPSNPT